MPKKDDKMANPSTMRAFGKDALSYIPAQVIPAVVGFFAIAAYTRLLTPEYYGQYVLVITTVSLVCSSAFSWLNQAGVRYFEEYKKNKLSDLFLSTAFISIFILLIFIFPIWYTVIIFIGKTWTSNFIRLVQIGGILLVSQTIYLFILVLFRASRRTFKYGLYTVLNSLGTFLIAISLIEFAGLGPEGILLAMIIVSGGIILFELTHLFKNRLIKISNYSVDLLKRFASYGLPMIGVSIGALVISISDRYIIQYFMGAGAVGIYSASYGLAQRGIQGISSILALAAFPVIFQALAQKGEQETSIVLGRMISIYLIALVPAVVGVAILSKEIVGVVLGKSFRNAYIILPWVAGGSFCHGLALYCNAPAELTEKTVYLFYILIFSAGTNIILNILWIPRFGILGAAYATFIAYFIYLIVTWIVGVRLFPFVFPWQTLGKAVAAALVMAVVLRVIFSGAAIGVVLLISKVVIGALVYFIVLGVLRERIFLDVLKVGWRNLARLISKVSYAER